MKLSILAMLFLACTSGFAQRRDSIYIPAIKDEAELLRLTQLMCSASETRDSAAYAHYIDENFLITWSYCKQNSYGKFFTKSEVISRWGKSLAPGTPAATSKPAVYRIQVSGNTGVVHSLILDQFQDKDGKQQKTYTWATDIWVKRKGQWRWLSSHESVLNEQ